MHGEEIKLVNNYYIIVCKILPSAVCLQCHCLKILERGFLQEIASGFISPKCKMVNYELKKIDIAPE